MAFSSPLILHRQVDNFRISWYTTRLKNADNNSLEDA